MGMAKGDSLIHVLLGLRTHGWGSSDSWKCQGGSGATSILVRNVSTIELLRVTRAEERVQGEIPAGKTGIPVWFTWPVFTETSWQPMHE